MDAEALGAILSVWEGPDLSVERTDGGFRLRLPWPPAEIELDADPDVEDRVVARARVEAAGDETDLASLAGGVETSRAGLLRCTLEPGPPAAVVVSHAVYTDGLSRNAFMTAMAEVAKAARQVSARLGSPAARPAPSPATQPAPTPVPSQPAPAPSLPAMPDRPQVPVPTPATWSPTHTTAPGVRAWAAPNPALPPVADLAPGTELRLIERFGEWARVDASNGWSGWVDARLLFPRG